MIEVRNISKQYSFIDENGLSGHLRALDSVNLEIEDGKIVTFLGPSGCGKSTLLEILAGQQIPTEGNVAINGKPVLEPVPTDQKGLQSYRKRRRFLSPLVNGLFHNRIKHDIAIVFQDYAVFPWMTVLKNVTFALALRGINRKDRKDIAVEFLSKVGLNSSLNKYPSQLSGGMKQRLALARALSVNPKIILMDEPFASVDQMNREQLQELLISIWESTGITIIIVTHDIEEAVFLSDSIVVFSEQPGRIRSILPIEMARPRDRKSSELISVHEFVSDQIRSNRCC